MFSKGGIVNDREQELEFLDDARGLLVVESVLPCRIKGSELME